MIRESRTVDSVSSDLREPGPALLQTAFPHSLLQEASSRRRNSNIGTNMPARQLPRPLILGLKNDRCLSHDRAHTVEAQVRRCDICAGYAAGRTRVALARASRHADPREPTQRLGRKSPGPIISWTTPVPTLHGHVVLM